MQPLIVVTQTKPKISPWVSINSFLFCTKSDSDFSPVKCLQAIEYRLSDFKKLLTWWPISLIPDSTNDFLRTLLKSFGSESIIWDIFSAIQQVSFVVTLKCSLSSSRILPATFGKKWLSEWSKSSSISKASSWSTMFSFELKSFSSYWLISKLFGKSLSKTFKYISENHKCLSQTCLLKFFGDWCGSVGNLKYHMYSENVVPNYEYSIDD